jgi:putative oxidoreductase
MNLRETAAAWQPQAQALLRIVVAYQILLHGTAKLFGMPHVAMFDNLQTFSLIWFAGLIEIVFGGLLLVGLCTRVSAFLLSGEMAIAYFHSHAPRGNALLPVLNGGDTAVTWCFVFLFFAAAGAGAWSVDAALRRPRG